jgi:arylsulfatase A-like enzyme
VLASWPQHAPARGLNDTYSAFLYTDGVLRVISNFTKRRSADPTAKLFVYLPWHNTHDPLEAPEEFMYPPLSHPFASRETYNAMARALDSGMGNITNALRDAGLWNETLLVFSADNGGWLLPNGDEFPRLSTSIHCLPNASYCPPPPPPPHTHTTITTGSQELRGHPTGHCVVAR